MQLQRLPHITTVDELLRSAYGADELGKTGHHLAGHVVIHDADVSSLVAKGQGSSLLYGELLPEGVVKLMDVLFSHREAMESSGPLLELGMGTGKVALHVFLSLQRDVYGVELAPSRWTLADAALQSIAKAAPDRFHHSTNGEGVSRLASLADGSICEFVCGSLLDTPVQLLASASAVIMEVCLPKDVQRQACKLLQRCQAGCRVVCYAPLHGLVEDCRLGPVRRARHTLALGDGMGGLYLSASWKPAGHGFAFYELCETAESARKKWAEANLNKTEDRVQLEVTGNPSRARNMKYTDDVLGSPRALYSWGKGDKVLVGYSWLPYFDLGNPGDSTLTGPEAVTWMAAWVLSVDGDGFASICYQDSSNTSPTKKEVGPLPCFLWP